MTDTHWSDALVRMGACTEAVAWARTQPDLATAWATCERGDWLLWLIGRRPGPDGGDTHRRLVLVACGCARLALPTWQAAYPEDGRPEAAIMAAEAWAVEPSAAASDAASDAAWAARAAASDAAGDAAWAARAAASDAASDAAWAAWAAASAAASDAAWAASLRASADIVRSIIDCPSLEGV